MTSRRGVPWLAACAAWMAAAVAPAPAAALDRTKALSQFAITVWTRSDGLVTPRVTALAQTTDGFIWVGTEGGLYRFDGVSFDRAGLGVPTATISALAATSDGSLWVGTTAGDLVRIQRSGATSWGEPHGYRKGYVEAIVEGAAGDVWVATAAGLRLYRRGVWQSPDDAQSLPSSRVLSVMPDGAGAWVGTDRGLARWPSPMSARDSRGCGGVIRSVLETKAGPLWVADMTGSVRAIDHACGVTARVTRGPTRPWRLLEDRDGGLWIATLGQGLWRLETAAGASTPTTFASGALPDARVTALLEDREGNLWAGTESGLARVSDGATTPFGVPEGLASDFVNAVAATPDGAILVGSQGGLDSIAGGRVRRVLPDEVMGVAPAAPAGAWLGTRRGLVRVADGGARPPAVVTTEPTRATVLSGDERGGLFVGDWFLGALHWDGRRLSRLDTLPGDAARRVSAAETDRQGRVWLGFSDGAVARVDGPSAPPILANGPMLGGISDLQEDQDGHMWAAAVSGLLRFDPSGASRAFDASDGLPAEPIVAVADTRDGYLWLAGAFGLARVAHADLAMVAGAPRRALDVTTYETDGLRAPPVAGASPRVALDAQRNLWLASTRGVVRVDLARLQAARPAPAAVLTRVMYDDTLIELDGDAELALPEGVDDIRITYTAPSFTSPQRLRFRYRLDGRPSWSDAGTLREALLTGLAPGSHTFEVQAAHAHDDCSGPPAVLRFAIAPAFYQTRWFAGLMGVVVASGLWGLHRVRLARVSARITRRLEERAAERLRIAHELHDTLLQSATAVGLHLQVLRDAPPATAAALQGALDDILVRVDQMSDEARRAVSEIRESATAPVTLASAFEQLVAEFQPHSAAAIRAIVVGEPRPLAPAVHDAVYRLTREALTNAVRHARAAHITAQLTYARRDVRISVRDDGIGMDEAMWARGRDGHFGLPGMRERARTLGATLTVTSAPGRGTTVEVAVPGA